jgi:small subunit ribosomal protein S15e
VFKKFTYRGVDLDKLLDMGHKEVIELLPARLRRRFRRGLKRKHTTLLKKLRKAVRRHDACVAQCV